MKIKYIQTIETNKEPIDWHGSLMWILMRVINVRRRNWPGIVHFETFFLYLRIYKNKAKTNNKDTSTRISNGIYN